MGGVPCIRDLRMPVASVVAMVADGMTVEEILEEHPDLEADDIAEALRYAALAVQERELPLLRASVRFLLDENLSPRVCPHLEQAGHDAVHVRDLGLRSAPDDVILATAHDQQRILISSDADFGALLAHSKASQPSLIFLRRQRERRAAEVAALVVANLGSVAEELQSGAIVVIDDQRIRVRVLPIEGT